jgi:hypothetical protein
MRRLERSTHRLRVWALGVVGVLAGACGGAPAPSDRGMGGTGDAAGSSGGSAASTGGGGAVTSGAGDAAGGSIGASGGVGAPVGGAGGSGGLPLGGGTSGAGGVAGTHGSAGGAGGIAGMRGDPGSGGSFGGSGGSGGSIAGSRGSTAGSGGGAAGGAGKAGSGGSNDCSLPATVSFQKDVQPFLSSTCGGGSCHVIDASSTVSMGGYDHAYDWITAGAHPSSCPSTPTPKRFEVVIEVIDAADPPSCSKSRMMPPQDETGANLRKPLTVCQIATLQAWLDEPLVTQMHRVDDTDPAGTAPFPMPPFN